MNHYRHNSSQIKPGDILRANFDDGTSQVFKVVRTIKVDDPSVANLPDNWSDYEKRGAHRIYCRDIYDGREFRYTWPDSLPYGRVELIGTKDDEGHWPVCRDCGDIWPCSEKKIMRDAREHSERVLSQAVSEFEKPFPCHWCDRFQARGERRRFASERGLKTHLRRCWSNPSKWNLDEWIPTFNDSLMVRGGFTPGSASDEYERMARRLAEAVKAHAESGTLPPPNEDARVIVEANA
jgi:hypothetical protein